LQAAYARFLARTVPCAFSIRGRTFSAVFVITSSSIGPRASGRELIARLAWTRSIRRCARNTAGVE